jgi:tetratricopeptide (TPR) repeat protein
MMDGAAPARAVAELANELIAAGRLQEATQLLNRHLAVAPADSQARYLIGLAAYKSNDDLRAETAFRQLASLPSPDPRHLYSLAMTLRRQGHTDEARHWFGAALAADPAFTQARVRLAELSQNQGRPNQEPPKGRSPLSEWNIPEVEELEEYRQRRLEKARVDMMIDNWYAIPWPVRAIQIVMALVILVAFLYLLAGFLAAS